MSYHANALCQAAMLEGMSSRDEKRLENRIRHLVTHNGIEFAISTLKQLRQHAIDNLDEDINGHKRYHHNDGDVSIAWNHKHDSPKGDLSVIYTTWKNPLPRIRGIGALIQSFQLDALSETQLDKFIGNVSSRNKATELGYKLLEPIITDKVLLQLDKNIARRVARMDEYSAVELTASALPVGTLNEPIAEWKAALGTRDTIGHNQTLVGEAIAQLDKHAQNQMMIAPKQSREILSSLADMSGNSKIKLLPHRKVRSTPFIARDYEFIRDPRVAANDLKPYIGTIGMLQQPGGKLRSVANINRFVNYTLDPYAKALEDTFYGHKSIGVLDQRQALKDVQNWIREGHELVSMDLTAATDLLDYRVLTERFKALGSRTPYLTMYAEYFEEISQLPLYVPDIGAISFETGQPLGTKGSFQTLTIMNMVAGLIASVDSDMDPQDSFRVVGDDFICKGQLANTYNLVISSWAGKTNRDKAMTSEHHGEFLSHIVTRDSIHKMKPHYRPGYDSLYINAEKSTTNRIRSYYKLSKQDVSLLESLALSGDPALNNASDLRGTVRLPSQDRELISRAKTLAASFSEGGLINHQVVSPQSLDTAHAQHKVFTNESRETDRRIYTQAEDGQRVELGIQRAIHLDEGRFVTSVDKFDHRTNSRKTIPYEITAKLARKRKLREDRESAKDNHKLVQSILDASSSEDISLMPGISVPSADLLAAATLDEAEQAPELMKQIVVTRKSSSSELTRSELSLSDEDLADLAELATESENVL